MTDKVENAVIYVARSRILNWDFINEIIIRDDLIVKMHTV